ncbi:uncharacterized protein LOC143074419 isoform X2 [Mytilus galloprovincialis]|uniref:uncharacterized protein LOC143074419 isoform X2 n=1 Tax=Mytilus galloprovincialis TaxID=29158 RepID=UPI003F7BA771
MERYTKIIFVVLVLVVLNVNGQATIIVCDDDCTERETEAFTAGFLLAILSGSFTSSFGNMMGIDMTSGMMGGMMMTTAAPTTTESTTTATTTASTVTVTPVVYPLSSMIICQDTTATIRCTSPSTLIISEGFYGLREANLCVSSPTANLVQTCSSSTANTQVITLCNGNTKCTLNANDATFANTCSGVKYLEVKYRCS